MPHIVVAGPLHPSGRALLDAAPGASVTYIAETSEESLAANIDDADAVLLRTQPLSAETVGRARRLRVVSRHGVGFDAVDVAALNARGIALAVCGDVNSDTVAEHAAMMILSASKRAMLGDAAVRRGEWEWRNMLESRDVRGLNLLLIGYGRIGRKIGLLMTAFGMNVRAYDPNLAAAGWPSDAVACVATLKDGLEWAEVISLSVPHAGEPLIRAEEFAQMRDGVVLINTARGEIVDETALVDALHSGKVAAAGIDVFANEPVPEGHPLLQFDQVLLTPHIAGLTRDAAERMAVSSSENILNYFDGTLDPALVVNDVRIPSGAMS